MPTTVSTDDYVRLLRDEVGLDVGAADLSTDLDDLAGWDSVHLLSLAVVLERHAGYAVSLPALLEARSLGAIHELVTR